jgi:DNA-binding NarL/FixJ family response regulator
MSAQVSVARMNVHSPALRLEEDAARFDATVEARGGSERSLRVLVVHDHDVIRSGFRLMLGRLPWVERCIGARTADDARALWDRYEPHVAVIDLFVGAVAGADLCRELRAARPSGQVILVSAAERLSPSSVIAAGAAGFISTGASAEELVGAVWRAGLGKPVAASHVVQSDVLSPRQRDVLELMASGHTRDLYRRLVARNRTEAVQRAQRIGLLA